MNSDLLNRIENSTAHTQNRNDNATFIIENLNLIPILIEASFEIKKKSHFRACCILEKVFELQIGLSLIYLDYICENLYKLKNDSAIRSISRFVMFLVQDNSKKSYLSNKQLLKIMEACFDWLIADYRVAVKAHAIYTLFELGKKEDWINPELRNILESDAINHSAGYKSVARKILKKLN